MGAVLSLANRLENVVVKEDQVEKLKSGGYISPKNINFYLKFRLDTDCPSVGLEVDSLFSSNPHNLEMDKKKNESS